jgi:predicted RNA-binding Zn ribbon-like protein
LVVMERKRQQAPGELEHVRDFVNTFDLERDTDQLGSPAQLAAWLRERALAPSRLRPTRAELARAIELREALRAILLAHNRGELPPAGAAQAVDDAARRARLRVRFDGAGGAALKPEAGGIDGALGRLLAIVHGAITQGTWERLKACREHSCEWAFYDHTKNRSGAWCAMQVCGNRAKARAYRARRTVSAA